MNQTTVNHPLETATEALVASINAEPRLRHLNRVALPSRESVVDLVTRLRELIYPGYFGHQELTADTLPQRIAKNVSELNDALFARVRCCLYYRQEIPETDGDEKKCQACEREARELVEQFWVRLPAVREVLSSDAQAAFDGDPAAQSIDETVFCYPGLFAITVQRLAHEFYKMNVPLLPRLMTEYAHSLTGIDIHPGAQLGRSFFIDHGTGVVIGETTLIGDNVKLYQGVTLGAVAPGYGQFLRGQKRHPTIEDDVTIYAGATILGGETIIGKGAVIGGNVFITSSVPPLNQVTAEPPKLKYRDRRPGKRAAGDGGGDFQI